MNKQAFQVIDIYCSKSIFSISQENEEYWIKLKEKTMHNQLSLSHITFKEIEENTYLLKLGTSIKGICNEKVIYENNVEYSGLIKVENYTDDALHMLMNINITSFIFPFVRAELLRGIMEAKMPVLNLQPIDFVGLYHSKKKQEAK